MPEKRPFVSIIIPVCHDWERLSLALDALERQTWPRERFEVIVINNDPADPFPDEYANRPGLRLDSEAKKGSYAARNRAIQMSRGDVLGFCDADCIPNTDWIEKAVAFLVENPGCFRMAGRIELVYGDSEKRTWAEMHERIFAFMQDEYARNGSSTTANMFAWGCVFDAVGGFDETLVSGGDLEWGKRADAAGFSIGYCENAVVRHPARSTMPELMEKARRVCSGYIRVNEADIRKNPLSALYHGLCMIKPPVKGGSMIFASKDLRPAQKMGVYFLEYLLKLVQFGEYVRCQTKVVRGHQF
ncbi:MAG: glycosyltransferase [Desulfobacterales bacterium]|nr:glycosyltransferase [Desulfobacterales bacterium]